MKKFRFMFLALLCLPMLFLAWCTDADVASHNLSKKADYFEIPRRIVFYNGITSEYILEIEWYCSLWTSTQTTLDEIYIICKDWNWYKKHFLWLSDNVTYVVEQLDDSVVSSSHYKIIFKPSAILPSMEIR
jgi:NADH:ubiquinone oxidoreductase subunit